MRFLTFQALLLICLLFPNNGLNAQISATGQSFIDSTMYPVFKIKDPIYIYNVSCKTLVSPATFLTASSPGALDSCNFIWTVYNSLTKSFDIPLKTDLNTTSSNLNNVAQGGYMVHITRFSGLDTTFRCWVFIHHLSVSVLKTAEGKVPDNKYTCQYVEINGTLSTDTFYYNDPASGGSLSLGNNTEYYWSYINKEGLKEKAFYNLTSRTYNPPVYDTHYYLFAKDKSGAACTDTVLYVSIQTRSKFEYKYYDHYGDSTGFKTMDEDGESAPAKFQFINHSINGATYEWILADTVISGDTAHRIVNVNDTLIKPEYTYYFPTKYTAKLISRSLRHCVDTSITDIQIDIRLPELDSIPNVFSPNGDLKNDYFVFYPHDKDDIDNSTNPDTKYSPRSRFASIKSFHIQIYDRWGRLVHEFFGDINDWVGSGKTGTSGGWDGKILKSNADASPGIYYYIISAVGWDNKVYKAKSRKGTVYLYR